jgi:uncharacterized protein YkwD
MPSPSAPRRRDLRQWEKKRRRPTIHPRRVVVGTVLVAGLLGAGSALNPFAAPDVPSAWSDATDVGVVVERASDAVSRGFLRDAADETAGAASGDAAGDAQSDAPGAVPSATATAEASPTSVPPGGSTTPTGTGNGQPAAPAPAAPATPAPADVPATVAVAQEIVVLTNAERRKAGLGELTVNDCATSMAVLRTQRLVAEGRFEHDPLGEIVDACGIGTLGENLALGYPTAAAAVAGWMGSEGHRANILRAGYTQIGVGCTSGPKGLLCGQVFLG